MAKGTANPRSGWRTSLNPNELSGDEPAATLFEGSVALLASHHGFADSPVALLRHPVPGFERKKLDAHRLLRDSNGEIDSHTLL